VPGRPSAAELKAMALRQQQQIDSQHQLLAAKEQRLRFLKAQEARGAAAAAEGERLRRLRERVEAVETAPTEGVEGKSRLTENLQCDIE
jgi:apoptosis-stimulating of p53 protein 1